jgi:Flp pilus assembly protein TadG
MSVKRISLRFRSKATSQRKPGQAIVEFALTSLVFLMIVFGTIDFGRAIFTAVTLHNAVREGARYGKVHPTESGTIQTMVSDRVDNTGSTVGSVGVSCNPSCTSGNSMTVTASIPFQAITQQLLGIDPFTLSSSSTVDIE